MAYDYDYDRSKQAVIRKEKGQYCVRSPDNESWNGGCYDSKGDAERRLEQVEYFKHKSALVIRVATMKYHTY